MKICLRHWQKPPTTTKIKVDGVGNCWECIPHENNKYCRCYYEITAPKEFEVKE